MSRSIKFGVWPEEVIERIPSPPMRLPLKIDWLGEPEEKSIRRLRNRDILLNFYNEEIAPHESTT